jgi:hypothetical protein
MIELSVMSHALTPALGRMRQENSKSEASLDCITRFCLKMNEKEPVE